MSEEIKQEAAERRRHRKEREGTVIKAAATKTVVVQVTRTVQHSTYGKIMRVAKNYACHDELGVQVGDKVLIRETRPLSKTKRWRVVSKAAQ